MAWVNERANKRVFDENVGSSYRHPLSTSTFATSAATPQQLSLSCSHSRSGRPGFRRKRLQKSQVICVIPTYSPLPPVPTQNKHTFTQARSANNHTHLKHTHICAFLVAACWTNAFRVTISLINIPRAVPHPTPPPCSVQIGMPPTCSQRAIKATVIVVAS